MQGIYPYASTITLAYLLFVLFAVEACFDSWLKKARYALPAVDIIVAVWFTFAITLSKAPLDTMAYTPTGEYPTGTLLVTFRGIRLSENCA